jgi:hypothetical protein
VDIPNAHTFLHRAIEMVAMNLYDYPSLMRSNSRDTEIEVRSKQQLLNSIIKDAIEDTITDRLSSASVLNYLDSVFQKGKFINDAVDLDEEDFADIVSGDDTESDSEADEGDAKEDEGDTADAEPAQTESVEEEGGDSGIEAVEDSMNESNNDSPTLAETFDVEVE